jgi:hypothetical protein
MQFDARKFNDFMQEAVKIASADGAFCGGIRQRRRQ